MEWCDIPRQMDSEPEDIDAPGRSWKVAEMWSYPDFEYATTEMPAGDAASSISVLGGEDIAMLHHANKDAVWNLSSLDQWICRRGNGKCGQIPCKQRSNWKWYPVKAADYVPFLAFIKRPLNPVPP